MNHRDINIEICRTLKLDPATVIKMVLTIEPGKLPAIEVTRMVSAADVDRLRTVVEVLQLAPVNKVQAP